VVSFTCPVCELTSFNPNDAREGFCGNCGTFPEQRRASSWVEQVGVHDVDGVSMFCRTCGLGLDRILNDHVGSAHWTGRRFGTSPYELFRIWLYGRLYPPYDCQQCVGQEEWRGCYCAYYGAPAPNVGPSRLREWLRSTAWRLFGVEGASYQADLGG
jgi:hypothetical protein